MQKLHKYIFTLLLATGLVACDTLDLELQNPRSLSPDLAFNSLDAYEAAVFSAYERVNDFGFYGQSEIIEPEIMADQLDFANLTGRYEEEYVNANLAHLARWGRYNGINDCNIVINGVDDFRSEDPAKADQVKGEAFFLRALNYHALAKAYAYEPGQEVNGWNEGVILRTTPSFGRSDADFRTRSTNLEVYQQIESDLLEAINLLPASPVAAPYRVGKPAAQALLSRVYLYWGRNAEAEAQATAAINGTGATLLTDSAAYMESWSVVPHPESVFESQILLQDWSGVDGVNNSLHSLTMNTSPSAQFIVVGSPELIAAIEEEPDDIRRGLWVAEGDFQMCTKWQGELGDFRENVPVIRYSELLLIRAEARYKQGNENGAREDLEELRAARGIADPVTAGGNALFNLILKERRVELALEGHRWYDLKRNGLDVPKTAASNQPTLRYTDFRMIAPIPFRETGLNPDLEQNPNY